MRMMRLAVPSACAFFALATPVAASAAQGAVEFCPALTSAAFPIGAPFGARAKTFGYDLSAPTPRSVTATLVADTSAGWYAWTVSDVALTTTHRSPHLRTLPRSFHVLPYVIAASPTLAVTFPSAVAIRHLWVTSANGTPCDVPAFEGPSDTVAPDFADVSPSISPLYAAAVASAAPPPFVSSGCDRPFVAATVTKPEAPDYPLSLREDGVGPLAAVIEVAVDPGGNLIAAWIYAASGFSVWDLSAERAALRSKYRGAISYCRPVKGTFLFLATAMPGG